MRVAQLEDLDLHRRHVEDGGDEVVGERRVADQPVDHLDLLHHGQPEALRDTAGDLAAHGERVQGLADVLRGGDLHDLHQAQFHVDVDGGPVRGERVLHVRVALPGTRVERGGRPVPPLHGLLDRLVAQYVHQVSDHGPVLRHHLAPRQRWQGPVAAPTARS